MAEIDLQIEGMHCGACVRRVTQALQAIPGAEVESVRVGAARVHGKNGTVTPQLLVEAVGKAGYSAVAEQSPDSR
jgi:copper chaperone